MLTFAAFGISLYAADLAQNMQVSTSASGPMLLGTGALANTVVQTAPAEQGAPLTLTPLFSDGDFDNIKEVSISNLFNATSGEACETCPKEIVMQVDLACNFWPVAPKATFRGAGTNGMEVVVDRGTVTVTGVPGQDPQARFSACTKATCSKVLIAGIDVGALRARAKSLGFADAGRRGLLPGCFSKASKEKSASIAARAARKQKEAAEAVAREHDANTKKVAKAGWGSVKDSVKEKKAMTIVNELKDESAATKLNEKVNEKANKGGFFKKLKKALPRRL